MMTKFDLNVLFEKPHKSHESFVWCVQLSALKETIHSSQDICPYLPEYTVS